MVRGNGSVDCDCVTRERDNGRCPLGLSIATRVNWLQKSEGKNCAYWRVLL